MNLGDSSQYESQWAQGKFISTAQPPTPTIRLGPSRAWAESGDA